MKRGEVYYKLIFPNYNKLSGYDDTDRFGTDTNPIVPTSDGVDQEGEVLSLCRKCPSHVITYDQLSDSPDNPAVIYDAENWPLSKKREIKRYVDYWKDNIPKYFNLRNYWDHDPPQTGGMSLMVSHSPEVGLTSTGWTKFNGDGTKVVYCSLMVSSGDFFYEFCLPNEVITKSGLANTVVIEKFHDNWYIRTTQPGYEAPESAPYVSTEDLDEKTYYWKKYSCACGIGLNPHAHAEKRVFVPHYFFEDVVVPIGKYRADIYDINGNPYKSYNDIKNLLIEEGTLNPTYEDILDRWNKYYTDDSKRYARDGYYDVVKDMPLLPNDPVYTVQSNIEYQPAYADTSAELDDHGQPTGRTKGEAAIQSSISTFTNRKNFQSDYIGQGKPWQPGQTISLNYGIGKNAAIVEASQFNEDLKHDFIALEVTRRILYYYNGTQLKYNDSVRDIHPTRDIPRVTGTGHTATVSYDPPDEYKNAAYTYKKKDGSTVSAYGTPPLQIPYDLLRYCLNDRPPFTDCETVLVMWVADRDPSTISDSASNKVQLLNELNWKQYAIPISIRCHYKNVDSSVTENKHHCNKRFLVAYPYYQSMPGAWFGGKYTKDNTDIVDYVFHFRFNEAYNKNLFKECLFTKDLMNYSQDYVIAYHLNSSTYTDSGTYTGNSAFFDIQKYLFKKLGNESCSALYIRKRYLTNWTKNDNDEWVRDPAPLSGRQTISQAYYLHVPKALYSVDYTKTNYILDAADTTNNTAFIPSNAPCNSNTKYFSRENFKKWDFSVINGWGPVSSKSSYPNVEEVCAVYDTWFIALFPNNSVGETVKGNITLVNASTLKNYLNSKIPASSNHRPSDDNWNDLYITSFGISPYNIYEDESYLYLPSKNDDYSHIYPLGLLNNHIQIDSTNYGGSIETYGTSHTKVVVGFKQMYDHQYSDLYHFRYDSSTNTYRPVRVIYDANTNTYPCQSITALECEAYVMNYSP